MDHVVAHPMQETQARIGRGGCHWAWISCAPLPLASGNCLPALLSKGWTDGHGFGHDWNEAHEQFGVPLPAHQPPLGFEPGLLWND